MKTIRFILVCLLFVSCNAPKVVYDFDESQTFDTYNTYAFFPDFKTGLSQLNEDRLVNSLENALQEKGLSYSASPDIYINVYTEEFQEDSRNSVGVGVGGGGGNMGVGVSGGFPIGGPENYIRITIDFIDVEEDALVWQAIVDSKFKRNAKPEARQAQLDKIVNKALAGYPPN